MHCYQMDTLEQSDSAKNHKNNWATIPPYYLVLININSRKGYAYPMNTKNSEYVAAALTRVLENNKMTHLYTDADRAYTEKAVANILKEKGVSHHTTNNDNKHALGIINRFIKTLRDENGVDKRDIEVSDMEKILKWYNSKVHSATNCAPNDWTESKNESWIAQKHREMLAKQGADDIHVGDRVRIPKFYDVFSKRRAQYEVDTYKVEGIEGNRYQVLKDGKLVTFSRFQLRKPVGNENQHQSGPPRDVLYKIHEYFPPSKEYRVIWEDNTTEYVKPESLRENPKRLTAMERKFWRDKPEAEIPASIRWLMPKYRKNVKLSIRLVRKKA